MQWKKKTNRKMANEMEKSPFQLVFQLVPANSVSWGNLKNEIATIESSAKLQIVKKSLMKKQTTSTLYKKPVRFSHGTTVLLTCSSFDSFQKIVNNLFFQKKKLPQTQQNKPVLLVHGKIQNTYINFYDLKRLSSLPQQSISTVELIKKPSRNFCNQLQKKTFLFLKLLKASNEN